MLNDLEDTQGEQGDLFVNFEQGLKQREAEKEGQPYKIDPSECATFRLCHGEWFFTLNLAWSGNEWRVFPRNGPARGIQSETGYRDQVAKLACSRDRSRGEHPIARGVKSVLAPASIRIPG